MVPTPVSNPMCQFIVTMQSKYNWYTMIQTRLVKIPHVYFNPYNKFSLQETESNAKLRTKLRKLEKQLHDMQAKKLHKSVKKN